MVVYSIICADSLPDAWIPALVMTVLWGQVGTSRVAFFRKAVLVIIADWIRLQDGSRYGRPKAISWISENARLELMTAPFLFSQDRGIHRFKCSALTRRQVHPWATLWLGLSLALAKKAAFALQEVENILIVTHGLTARFLMMRYFRWSISTFESVFNLRCATGAWLAWRAWAHH